MPAAIRAIPPKTSSPDALMGANVVATPAEIVFVAIAAESTKQVPIWWQAPAPASICRHPRGDATKRGHHMLGKHVLRLDALPMLKAAEVGDNSQLADSTLGLQFTNLAHDFLRCSNEPDFLFHDLIVGQPGQRLQRAAGIKSIALGLQLSLHGVTLKRLDRRGIER